VLRSFGDIVANHVGSGLLISELNVSEDIFVVQTDIPCQYPYRCQTFLSTLSWDISFLERGRCSARFEPFSSKVTVQNYWVDQHKHVYFYDYRTFWRAVFHSRRSPMFKASTSVRLTTSPSTTLAASWPCSIETMQRAAKKNAVVARGVDRTVLHPSLLSSRWRNEGTDGDKLLRMPIIIFDFFVAYT